MIKSQHEECLICSSKNISKLPLYSKTKLLKCDDCDFVFCQEIPTKNTLEEFYRDSYELTSYLSPVTINRFNELLDHFEQYRKTGKILDIGAGYGFFFRDCSSKRLGCIWS